MSKYIRLIVSMIAMLIFASWNSVGDQASQNQKIFKGSFGINFGNTYNTKGNINTIKRHNVLMYEIDPPSKIKYFDKYYVAITPKTHKIYAIYAKKRYQDFLEALDNFTELEDILSTKYGKGEYKSGVSTYFVDSGFLKINTFSSNEDSNKLTFYYFNSKYANIADKEKIELVENRDSL